MHIVQIWHDIFNLTSFFSTAFHWKKTCQIENVEIVSQIEHCGRVVDCSLDPRKTCSRQKTLEFWGWGWGQDYPKLRGQFEVEGIKKYPDYFKEFHLLNVIPNLREINQMIEKACFCTVMSLTAFRIWCLCCCWTTLHQRQEFYLIDSMRVRRYGISLWS